MSKLLIDESPLIVLPTLARIVGLEEAIVLQQVHYWLNIYKKANDRKHFRNGKWWVYNSLDGWQENFPFWSLQTLRRNLESLRKEFAPKDRRYGKKVVEKDLRLPRNPLLLTDNFNVAGYDRTLWYTIDYDELSRLEESFAELPPFVEDQQMDLLNTNKSSVEDQQMDLLNTNTPIPETTRDYTEITAETPATSVAESPATPPENSPELGLGEALENLERLDNLDRLDYLDHLAALDENATGQSWTVPTEAGGADGLGKAMLAAWLKQKGVTVISDVLRKKWARWLSKLALDSGLMGDGDGSPALTREQATRAVEIVLEPGSVEFGYYTYNNPANRKFQQDWTEVALRLLNGGTGYRDNGDPARRDFDPATMWHDDDCPEIEVNSDGTLRSHI